MENKDIDISDFPTEHQTEYVYSHIEYSIEKLNRDKKAEKMRALYGMAKSLFCSMIGLLGVWLAWMLYNIKLLTAEVNELFYIRLIAFPIYLIISTIIYYNRAKRCMKYRVRMMFGIYESCFEDIKEVSEE